jgi:hypothetical protein
MESVLQGLLRILPPSLLAQSVLRRRAVSCARAPRPDLPQTKRSVDCSLQYQPAIALHTAVHEGDVGFMAIAKLYREHRINPFPSTKEKTY